MMAERSINEPAEVVEDHGGLLDVAMVCTPFAPAMADWRQGKRQEMGIVVVHLLYKQPTRVKQLDESDSNTQFGPPSMMLRSSPDTYNIHNHSI